VADADKTPLQKEFKGMYVLKHLIEDLRNDLSMDVQLTEMKLSKMPADVIAFCHNKNKRYIIIYLFIDETIIC
jgi:hypothetical protein